MKTDSILNKQIFERGMLKLEAAFRVKQLTRETLEIYYEMLHKCDDKTFLGSIDDIIKKEQWFPPISKLLEYLPNTKPLTKKEIDKLNE